MSKKRFEFQNQDNHLNMVYDNEDGKVIFDEDIVDLLNALHEENQLLKNKLKFFNELNKPYGSIIKENKELKNKLHFVMKRLNEKDKLLARVLEVNKNLEKKNK